MKYLVLCLALLTTGPAFATPAVPETGVYSNVSNPKDFKIRIMSEKENEDGTVSLEVAGLPTAGGKRFVCSGGTCTGASMDYQLFFYVTSPTEFDFRVSLQDQVWGHFRRN